jgi:hypothetical protein
MKKSQMEIMGLIIMIMLVLVGILVYIFFKLGDDGSDRLSFDEYKKTQMAQNYVNTLMDVTTTCNSLQVKNLMAECEKVSKLGIPSGLSCGSGRSPCEEIEFITEATISESLRDYSYKFVFSIRGDSSGDIFNLENVDGFSCKNKVAPGIFPIYSSLSGRILELRLDICS